MKNPYYNFEASPDALRFEFNSLSPDQNIRKVIEYTPLTLYRDIYNLAFGDLNEDGSINDLIVSNNNDMEMVIATVIQTILIFCNEKSSKVYFSGSTKIRTRFYQMIITKYYEEFKYLFEISGIRNGKLESFVKNENYEAFLIHLKKNS